MCCFLLLCWGLRLDNSFPGMGFSVSVYITLGFLVKTESSKPRVSGIVKGKLGKPGRTI